MYLHRVGIDFLLPLNSVKNHNISYDPASLQIDTNETIHNVNLHNISLRIFMDIGLKNMSARNKICWCFYFCCEEQYYLLCNLYIFTLQREIKIDMKNIWILHAVTYIYTYIITLHIPLLITYIYILVVCIYICNRGFLVF